MIFVLASCNGNGGLVASKDDRDENCSMRVWIEGDEVLFVKELART